MARLLLETLNLEFDASLFPQWWEVFDLYGWQGIVLESAADRALWSKFDKLCRSRGKNIVVATCRRHFTFLKQLPLRFSRNARSASASRLALMEPRLGLMAFPHPTLLPNWGVA